jgi:hypothetical protein
LTNKTKLLIEQWNIANLEDIKNERIDQIKALKDANREIKESDMKQPDEKRDQFKRNNSIKEIIEKFKEVQDNFMSKK